MVEVDSSKVMIVVGLIFVLLIFADFLDHHDEDHFDD